MESCKGHHVRLIILFCIIFTLCGVVYFGYFCSDKDCALSVRNPTPDYARGASSVPHPAAHDIVDRLIPYETKRHSFIHKLSKYNTRQTKFSFDDMSSKKYTFDIDGVDVLVFLHIQKTGGTSFGRHLVQDLDLDKPCDCRENRKKCRCTRPSSDTSYWLFSRYSTGWQCGLHADWTELTNCVPSALDQREGMEVKRRYFYVTLLRDPVQRFLSEFLHVQRGATWKQARHWCGGREALPSELPPCFPDETWEEVELDDFMACPSNLAVNRQTRMLANLELVGCYNTSFMSPQERDLVMLASAKDNLRKMAFFGLCEHQRIDQYLFESTFGMRFLTQFQQFNETHVASAIRDISPEQLDRIKKLNHLDVELYEFASALLMDRFEQVKKADSDFERHFRDLGRLRRADFRWEDIED